MTSAAYPVRKPLRLPDFDYSQPADYFITIVTHQRERIMGQIQDAEMIPSANGRIVLDLLNALPGKYPLIALGPYMLMPNHLHMIITITDYAPAPSELPQLCHQGTRRKMTLPLVIGYLKMNTARQINLLCKTPSTPVWQRNYYEHIIGSKHEFGQIEAYILNNPANWQTDNENIVE